MTELDLSVLRDRMEQQRNEIEFYHNALKLLIEKHEVHNDTTLEFLKIAHSEIDERILVPISLGAVPLKDDLNRANSNQLAELVNDLLNLAGAAIGLGELLENQEDQTYAEYINILLEAKEHPSYHVHWQGFTALSLLTGRAPSCNLWCAMFPLSEEPDVLAYLVEKVLLTYADCVYNYVS